MNPEENGESGESRAEEGRGNSEGGKEEQDNGERYADTELELQLINAKITHLKELRDDLVENIESHSELLSDTDRTIESHRVSLESNVTRLRKLVSLSSYQCLLATICGLILFLLALAVCV